MFTAQNLSASIGDRVLYRALDLRVDAGECVALLGPSGSGKSTLLRHLAGLLTDASGTLALSGVPATAMGWPAWRRRVRLCPQRAVLPPGTPADWVEEVLSWGGWRDAVPDASQSARAAARDWEVAESIWAQPWSTLSGGEAQRVHLAIALALPADLLLLDEPTSALDAAVAARVEATLAGRSAIWITHDEAQAERVATRVVRLGASA